MDLWQHRPVMVISNENQAWAQNIGRARKPKREIKVHGLPQSDGLTVCKI